MAVTVYWDDMMPQCLRVDLLQPWTWQEFREASQSAKLLLEKVPQAQGYMVDVREAGDLPPAGFLTHSRNVLQELPPLPMVFIANTSIMQIIFQPVAQLFRVKRQFYFVRSLEAARELFQQSSPANMLG